MAIDQATKRRLANVPRSPGVYTFSNAKGKIIYVGKAIDLRSRLSQYFHGQDERPQIPFMMEEMASFDFTIVSNEVESLLLENNLIKKYRPKYNIRLRDDKSYAFIKVDYSTEIPQIYVSRNNTDRQARYFGPYSSSAKVRDTLHLVRKIFPYCANQKVSDRPCFYYHLHRCPGVCIGKVSLEEYRQSIKKIEMFLAGDIARVERELKSQMAAASRQKRFERAAVLRDQMNAITVVEERQKAIFPPRANWDFISLFQTLDLASVNVFAVRSGKLNDRKNFIMEGTEGHQPAEIVTAFIQTYYADASDQPREIYVPTIPIDTKILAALFIHPVAFAVPTRGKKRELIDLGVKNARDHFERWSCTCPMHRAESSASTSRTSRGQTLSPAWWWSSMASQKNLSTESSK